MRADSPWAVPFTGIDAIAVADSRLCHLVAAIARPPQIVLSARKLSVFAPVDTRLRPSRRFSTPPQSTQITAGLMTLRLRAVFGRRGRERRCARTDLARTGRPSTPQLFR